MQFNSFVFILLFMPVTVALYFLSNRINVIFGKIVIILSSLIFYTAFDFKLSYILLLSSVLNLAFALLMEKTKKGGLLFWTPVVVNIALLFFFKYTNFSISMVNRVFGTHWTLLSLVQPIGISFFTFQEIAYITAVHKGEIGRISILDYLSYILYFPKILMGPLMDPVDFIAQINDTTLKKLNPDNLASGIKIFSYGLFKKVMLADVFQKAVSWGFGNQYSLSSLDWILVTLFYTFEIYFDFSGYSDMATGVSEMLNITLPINFDSPYKALSIRDFWKRWHISLTQFFTRYVYIPLGGGAEGHSEDLYKHNLCVHSQRAVARRQLHVYPLGNTQRSLCNYRPYVREN